jgi:hypothetical protein
MNEYFQPPYPARSTIEVAGLPKGAQVEVDAIRVSSDRRAGRLLTVIVGSLTRHARRLG